jgi:phosphatidylglycerol lysyltransferase
MRYRPAAVHGVMEWLLIQLMLYGKAEGYRWFNLGMAPFSGIAARDTGPLWNRLSSLAYRHGERLYNFQGLRRYKEKFAPEWRAVYLASPGGLALPLILTNIATLIAGGTKRLVRR